MVDNTLIHIKPFQKEKTEYLCSLSLDMSGLVEWWGEVREKTEYLCSLSLDMSGLVEWWGEVSVK